MSERQAVCLRCGDDKDLALGRCGACGLLPTGADRELALIASRRMLSAEELDAVAARIRRGERLDPPPELRRRAHALMRGEEPAQVPAALTRAQFAGLVAANLLLTPMIGWAVWFRWRTRPGPGARQVVLATLPVAAALTGAWLAWFGAAAGH